MADFDNGDRCMFDDLVSEYKLAREVHLAGLAFSKAYYKVAKDAGWPDGDPRLNCLLDPIGGLFRLANNIYPGIEQAVKQNDQVRPDQTTGSLPVGEQKQDRPQDQGSNPTSL